MPFVNDSQSAYESVGVGIFKVSSLMDNFPLPLVNTYKGKNPLHMISSFTNGSLRSNDPWGVPSSMEVGSYGVKMTLNAIKVASPAI